MIKTVKLSILNPQFMSTLDFISSLIPSFPFLTLTVSYSFPLIQTDSFIYFSYFDVDNFLSIGKNVFLHKLKQIKNFYCQPKGTSFIMKKSLL